MRLSVARDPLLTELQLLQGVAEKKKTIPILSNVLLRADEGFLRLAATDLEVSLTGGCDAEVEEAGSVTVSAKKFFEIIRSLPAGPVAIAAVEADRVEISSGVSVFHLVGLPVDDFPEVPESDFGTASRLPGELLRAMIGRTLFAVTQEDTRYALNGALLEMGPGLVRMVATDAHRLAVVERDLEAGAGEVSGIIPKKALAELRTLTADGEILFAQDQRHLYFRVGSHTLATRLIEGQFPAYEKVIPVDNPIEARFRTEQMANAIRRVGLLASERSRAVRFSFAADEVVVSTSNPELGDAREAVAVQYRGEELEISFNAQYILDFLGAVAAEEVVFQLRDANSQGLLVPVGDEGGGYRYRYVVMPMRL